MITNLAKKTRKRLKRKRSIRKRVIGTPERPRVTVFRSLHHTYAQVIDDASGKTLASASTMDKELKEQVKGLKKGQAAEKVGAQVANAARKKGLSF